MRVDASGTTLHPRVTDSLAASTVRTGAGPWTVDLIPPIIGFPMMDHVHLQQITYKLRDRVPRVTHRAACNYLDLNALGQGGPNHARSRVS